MSPDAPHTIGELAQLADVTTRTIRYYVAQGLLPPPRGGGRAAAYGDAHLHRLELIKLLKQEFLPLNKIRTLLDGLDDHAVYILLTEKRPPPPTPASETAKEYLHTLLDPEAKAPSLLRQTVAARAQSVTPPPSPTQPDDSHVRSGLLSRSTPVPSDSIRIAEKAKRSEQTATVWQRYSIHPDVELQVRRPATDARLGARLDQFLVELRLLVEGYSS